MSQSQIVPPLSLYNPRKFVKTVHLHPIKYSSLAEFVCNFDCVDGYTAPWCIRQRTTRSISTIYTTTTDLSKSSFFTSFLNCFLFRTPTLSGRNKKLIFIAYFESENAFGKIQALMR